MTQKPEKEKATHERPFLGKLEKNHCRIGIVGLPNVGKSSFFNTLSEKQVQAENYAFCTIKPSQTQVPIHDKRFNHLCKSYKPKSKVPAVLDVWDIAGLVQGAHEGKGLGNEFLSNIQSVDGIYHVVRAFRDKKINHVEGSVDPIRDLQIIHNELRQKDLQMLQKKYDNSKKLAERNNDKKLKEECQFLEKVIEYVKSGKDVLYGEWNNKETDYLRSYRLFCGKPVTYLVNVSKQNWLKGSNKWIESIKEWVNKNAPGASVIPFSATFEKELIDMNEKERKEYLKKNKLKSMLNKIIKTGYTALGLIHFFTAGADEVKCWTIRNGTKAPQAAGTIHSDMEQGFICAETFKYSDFKELGSEHAVKSAGKYMSNGKNYVVEDGDVLYFKFNKPNKPKKKN